VTGIHADSLGYQKKYPRILEKTRQTDNQLFMAALTELENSFDLTDTSIVRSNKWEVESQIKEVVRASKNMKLIEGPFKYSNIPVCVKHEPIPEIKEILKAADIVYWKQYGVNLPMASWDQVLQWDALADPLPSLRTMSLSSLSFHRMAYATRNKLPIWKSSTENLYPTKVVEMVKLMDRDQSLKPGFDALQKKIPKALDVFYRYGLKTHDRMKTVKPYIDLKAETETMPLHTSQGLQVGSKQKHVLPTGEILHINPCGKKLENLDASLQDIMDMFEKAIRPLMPFESCIKLESQFSRVAQDNPVAWKGFLTKGRVFIIAGQTFTLLERITSMIRHLFERGEIIRVGQSWSHAGADEIARILGAFLPGKRKYFEGDFKKFDYSVKSYLMELYFSQSLVYFDPDLDKDTFDLLHAIVEIITQEIISRIQHIFGSIWAVVNGMMPSGCFNTSHGDSWIVAFLWFLYCVDQMTDQDPVDQTRLWEAIVQSIIRIIVYGDDHLISMPDDPLINTVFSYTGWIEWLRKWWDMEIRDYFVFDHFETDTYEGFITRRGPCFLQQYFTLNPIRHQEGQPTYLPFRDSPSVMLRLAHGTEPKKRDLLDLMLSLVGHGYCTYGANTAIHEYMSIAYRLCLQAVGRDEQETLAEALTRSSEKSLRKFRQKGVSDEDLLKGYPSLATLQAQNVKDPSKHNFRYRVNNTYDDNLFDDE